MGVQPYLDAQRKHIPNTTQNPVEAVVLLELVGECIAKIRLPRNSLQSPLHHTLVLPHIGTLCIKPDAKRLQGPLVCQNPCPCAILATKNNVQVADINSSGIPVLSYIVEETAEVNWKAII